MKEIATRLNTNPRIARLALVNPIYALADLGVQLSPEMKQHLFTTFHDPPAKQRRIAELENEIRAHLNQLPDNPALPNTPVERADLLFNKLRLTRDPADSDNHLDIARLARYSHQHPLIEKLVEYEVVRRSGLVFHPRATYDAYSRGEMKQNWVNSVRFGSKPAVPAAPNP
ncbi:MAG: hypothetical protein M3Y07_04110 [Acidobacteriota bacterium]|nr:hypothetical protein [Acidobacteriota bacterium]